VLRRKRTPYWDAALAHVRSKQPRFFVAVVADARITSTMRGEPWDYRGPLDAALRALRLMWITDGFFALVMYRAQSRLDVLGVPVLPRIAHRLAIMTADLYVGETVLMHPGVFVGHGMVVIDGFVEVSSGVRLAPGVTIGLRGSTRGPVIERDVLIGTGAKVLGELTVGRGARIGANAVVISDVPPGATVVGVPARITD
jgi:serine O-acetyltransferase